MAERRPSWSIVAIDPLFHDEHHRLGEKHAYGEVHPYLRGMKDVLRCVNKYQPAKVLDIGSPLVQNVAVSYLTKLTVLDVRAHEDASLGLQFLRGTACDIPLSSGSQEMVTSLWVMCHVGDGRYGDTLELDGDLKMLQEIYRVLMPNGLAVLGVGPVADAPSVLFNAHRIYSWEWLAEQFGALDFEILEQGEYPVRGDMFVGPEWTEKGSVPLERHDGAYGFVVLKKGIN